MNVHIFEPAGAMELRVASHLSHGSDVERVIRKFINTVAGTRKNAMGVSMAWELALHDVLNVPGSVPLLAGMMNVMFPDVMEDLLADAPEFLSEVLSVRESILRDVFQ